MNVGKFVKLAALNTGEALKVGTAELPVKFPNTVFDAAEEATKLKVGVVDAFATDVVNKGDKLPDINVVTVPAPVDDPVKLHVVPEQDPAPLEKLKVNAPGTVFMLDTPEAAGLTHTPDASHNCVPVPPVGQVTTCELALLELVQGVPPFRVIEAMLSEVPARPPVSVHPVNWQAVGVCAAVALPVKLLKLGCAAVNNPVLEVYEVKNSLATAAKVAG